MSTTKYIQLEKELAPYKKMMGTVADNILDQEVSKYPIFVIHQHEVEVGIPLTDEDQVDLWSINASSLEEFVSKQLIEEIKIDSFRTIYKDPTKHLCLFVLSELGANFIFLPRTDQEPKK